MTLVFHISASYLLGGREGGTRTEQTRKQEKRGGEDKNSRRGGFQSSGPESLFDSLTLSVTANSCGFVISFANASRRAAVQLLAPLYTHTRRQLPSKNLPRISPIFPSTLPKTKERKNNAPSTHYSAAPSGQYPHHSRPSTSPHRTD